MATFINAHEELKEFIPTDSKTTIKNFLTKSATKLYEMQRDGKGKMKRLKKQLLLEKEIANYVEEESKEFSKHLLDSIESAGNTETKEITEREKNKQFIAKLIENIGKCGKHSGKSTTTKYLIMSFIEVISMAGKNEETAQGKLKAKENVLVNTNKIKNLK